jgi:ribosomal protein L29
MKSKEINKKTKKELVEAIEEKKVLLRDIRFGNESKTKNVKVELSIKKDIAKLMTFLKNS